MIVIAGVRAHGSTRDSVFSEGDARGYGLFGKGTVLVVAVELVGLRVVGDEEVGPAVAVVVEEGDAQGLTGGVSEAGPLGDIFELAVAQIVVELRRCPLVGLGGAVGFGGPIERAPEIAFLGPADIVGHEQIELTVAVVIEPDGA